MKRKHYLHDARLNKASALLQGAELSIAEITLAVGFLIRRHSRATSVGIASQRPTHCGRTARQCSDAKRLCRLSIPPASFRLRLPVASRPSGGCGLGRSSVSPTPASPSGEAPAVRNAPGRFAPAPLPCSGVSAPSLPGPGRPHPRGRAGTGSARPSGLRRKIDIMATKTRTENAAKPNTRNTNDRKLITLEMALALCPNAALADNLSTTFGLDPVDAASIRETTEEHVALAAKILPLSDKALEMHLQRIVGGFVGSAYGAGQFYSTKVTQARDLTAKSANDHRDEDRDGISGFETRAERARNFRGRDGAAGTRPCRGCRGCRLRLRSPHGSGMEALRSADHRTHDQPRQRRSADGRFRVRPRRGLRPPPSIRWTDPSEKALRFRSTFRRATIPTTRSTSRIRECCRPMPVLLMSPFRRRPQWGCRRRQFSMEVRDDDTQSGQLLQRPLFCTVRAIATVRQQYRRAVRIRIADACHRTTSSSSIQTVFPSGQSIGIRPLTADTGIRTMTVLAANPTAALASGEPYTLVGGGWGPCPSHSFARDMHW